MKRTLSFILALVLLVGLMPMQALASENEPNPWEGRSAVFVGDSITAGSGTTKIYYEYLEESLGFGSVTPMGIAGSCISAASDYGQSNQPLINRYQDIPSADLIVIFMGTNDYGHETPLGSVEDTQDGTFYGALNVIIPALVAEHPSSKLVFVTSLHRYGFGTSKILGTKFTYDNIPNGVGATLTDYVDALKTVCAANGVSVIDLHTECTLDPADAEVRTAYMPDGLHPNAAGHEVLAGIMESHIRGFEPVEQEPVELTEMVYGNRFATGNNQTCRASSRINYYLKAGTVITLKDSAAMQWACTKTSDETSSSNLGYFPDSGWSDKETAVVEADGWVGFVFKYRDETQAFDLTKALSDYITIEEPHTHSYTFTVTVPTCTAQGYTTYTCACGDSYVDDYVDATGHTYDDGLCTLCGAIADGTIWQITKNGIVIGAYADLQGAVDACEAGGTILLTTDCAVTAGVILENSITIDGGNHLVDISGCSNAFITIGEGAEVTIRDLKLDGGADGFEVDYDAVTYTNYTIPLKAGSLANDPKANQSAIISNGILVCENVDVSNRYTASVGGAMQILAGSVKLTDCDFTHNYGTSKGGALFIGSNFGTRTAYPVEMVTIQNCTFTKNYTGHGGAIYAYNMTEMVIENTLFFENTANGGKGGAIDLFSETTKPTTAMALGLDFMQTTIRDCTFRDNWAGNDGFAIQSYDSDLYIYDSEFIDNVGVHPTSSVGTVSIEAYRHADESQRIYTLMDGCLFEGNRGPCAVYGDHSSISDLDVTNCIFRNNVGNMSFLLYSATTNMSGCEFVGEVMNVTVMDARIYENYTILPLLTMTDVTFADCAAPTEILTRKQNHDESLNTYQVILQGTTNGDITIWDNNAVTILGNHTGNVLLGYGTERSHLTIGDTANVNGIIAQQPESVTAAIGERFAVTVETEGENLTYQWYYKDAGMKNFRVSSNKTSSYAYTMMAYMHNRQVYCVITDANGNSVTTETATITRPPQALKITQQPQDVQVNVGEKFSISPRAQGDGLTYQWYYKDAGMKTFRISSNKSSAYAYTMQSYMKGRQVYCVITDQYGSSVTTEVATISLPPVELKILTQPTDVYASRGEKFSISFDVQGDGLTYQWYYKDAGMKNFRVSSNRTSAYAYAMQNYMNNRQVYCVITDRYGNQVVTEVVTIWMIP